MDLIKAPLNEIMEHSDHALVLQLLSMHFRFTMLENYVVYKEIDDGITRILKLELEMLFISSLGLMSKKILKKY